MTKHLVAHNGRKIMLPNSQRLHIAYFHPEVLADETKMELTVEPELVARGATEDTRISYRFFVDTPVKAKYLAVIIRLLDDEGFIVTTYFTEKLKKERVIWRRTS